MAAQLADAIALWRRGYHNEAEQACTALLAVAADPAPVRALLAEIYSARGNFRAAGEQLQRVTDRHPTDTAAWRRLGDAQFAAGAYAEAADSFRHAIALEPTHPRAHHNLGRALARLVQADAAIESYRRAIEIDPHYAIAYNNLGMALAESERPAEALACYERAVALNPKLTEAIGNQGNALLRLGRADEALGCFERALAQRPADVTVLCNCGNALLQLHRVEPGLACFERALELIPDFPAAHLGIGNARRDSRQFGAALERYDRALGLQSDYLDALINKAGVLIDTEQFDAAVDCCSRLLRSRADYPQGLYLRALARNYLGGGHYEQAVTDLARLWEVAPDLPFALGMLVHTSSMIFDWSHAARATDAIRATRNGKPLITPLALLAISDDPELQAQCARDCVAATHPPAAEQIWHGERWHNRKIRIAYISGDLRDHALSYLMVGVFEQHDREKFEILGVSLREPLNNAFGARLVSALDAFIDVKAQTDHQVARLLFDMKVDIAVDLMGITRGHRLNIFGHRAAPVQVNYLGYPGTSGAGYIDYILADPIVIPPETRRFYAESVVYLPDCFQANDDRRAIADICPSRSDVGLPPSAFVFCSFNSSYKITPRLFDVWCRLLQARSGSVLWMLAESNLAQSNLRREALARGIDPQRLVFAPRLPYEQHLARLGLADLFLDSFPFNAGATASDALWAGLPVLTCAGEAFAARMAASLLQAIGLPELITTDLQAYELLALQLSASPEPLRGLRARLAANRTTHSLFDTARFCRHLEVAYETMHQRQLRGQPPDQFSVAALSAAAISRATARQR
jgi:protein O-GlcNAc transferase